MAPSSLSSSSWRTMWGWMLNRLRLSLSAEMKWKLSTEQLKNKRERLTTWSLIFRLWTRVMVSAHMKHLIAVTVNDKGHERQSSSSCINPDKANCPTSVKFNSLKLTLYKNIRIVGTYPVNSHLLIDILISHLIWDLYQDQGYQFLWHHSGIFLQLHFCWFWKSLHVLEPKKTQLTMDNNLYVNNLYPAHKCCKVFQCVLLLTDVVAFHVVLTSYGSLTLPSYGTTSKVGDNPVLFDVALMDTGNGWAGFKSKDNTVGPA